MGAGLDALGVDAALRGNLVDHGYDMLWRGSWAAEYSRAVPQVSAGSPHQASEGGERTEEPGGAPWFVLSCNALIHNELIMGISETAYAICRLLVDSRGDSTRLQKVDGEGAKT